MVSYLNASYACPDNSVIKVDINGVSSFVPCVVGNTDYRNILDLLDKGEIVIHPYEG